MNERMDHQAASGLTLPLVEEPLHEHKATGNRCTEGDVIAMLRERYSDEGYAFFTQVRSQTGYGGERYADAVVMSLWPSRGYELLGFEIKVHRSDWLKELNSPEKAEAICQFCDRWTIVAPRGVVKPEELPQPWGLMIATEKGLRVTKTAPALTPAPMSRGFIASILRQAARSQEKALEQTIQRRVQNELKKSQDSLLYWKEQLDRAEKEATALRNRERDFIEQFGIPYFRANVPELGQLMEILLNPVALAPRMQLLRSYFTSLHAAVRSLEQGLADVATAGDSLDAAFGALKKEEQQEKMQRQLGI